MVPCHLAWLTMGQVLCLLPRVGQERGSWVYLLLRLRGTSLPRLLLGEAPLWEPCLLAGLTMGQVLCFLPRVGHRKGFWLYLLLSLKGTSGLRLLLGVAKSQGLCFLLAGRQVLESRL